MELYNKTLCLTFEELTDGVDPIIKPKTLLQNTWRGKITCARQGKGEGNYALYVWSSLPQKYKDRFIEQRGDPEKMMEEERLMEMVTIDAEARAFYEAFEYGLNGVQTHLPESKIGEYTTNASVMNALMKSYQTKSALTKTLNNGRRDIWSIVWDECEELREVTNHTLPGTLARLKKKIAEYRKEGYVSLVSGKFGNKNTLKVGEEAKQMLIALKRQKLPVLTDAQILEEFNKRALEYGWKTMKSIRSLKAWLNAPENIQLWHGAVHDEHASHQMFMRRHKSELPQMRDALWYGDGTKLNLYYLGDDGKVRTTNVYEVIDAATEMLLGYHISDTENYEQQYHAYRMAIQVSGHKPYEIVHDNQGGHKKANSGGGGVLDKICHIHRATAPYNGASKTIEQAFGQFQQQVLHKNWNFTGQNVTATKAMSKPDVEFIAANKESLPTLDEVKEMYAEARKEWNNMKRPGTEMSRREMYESTTNEESPAITPREMQEIFWVLTKQPVTFTSGGISIQVNGKKHTYEVYDENGMPDHAWRRKNTLGKFYVQYDPYDMSSVNLFRVDKAGERRFERIAKPYMTIHRAIQEQTEGEAAFIRHEQEANLQDRIDREMEGRRIEWMHGVAPEQHGMKTPKLKGINKAAQEQIERRTHRYAMDAEEVELGRATKYRSMLVWDVEDDKEEVRKRANSKL